MYWCSLSWQMCTTCATCCMLLVTRLYRTCEKCTKCAKSWTTCVQWQWCDDALAEFNFQGIHYLKLVHNMYNKCDVQRHGQHVCNGNGVAKHSLNSITAANPPFLQYLNTAIQQYSNTAIQLCREFYYGRQASFFAIP